MADGVDICNDTTNIKEALTRTRDVYATSKENYHKYKTNDDTNSSKSRAQLAEFQNITDKVYRNFVGQSNWLYIDNSLKLTGTNHEKVCNAIYTAMVSLIPK